MKSAQHGLWIVLGWLRKPKKLGTGFMWQQLTKPAPYAQADNDLKTFQKKLQVRVWPVRS